MILMLVLSLLLSSFVFSRSPLVRPIKECKFNVEVRNKILEKLKKKQSAHRRAILKGLLWTTRYLDEDDPFEHIFSEYITMLYEMSHNKKDSLIKKISEQLIKNAFIRARPRLKKIYDYSLDSKWDFISVLPILYRYNGVDLKFFKRFYKHNLPRSKAPAASITFHQASMSSNYDVLTDYISEYSFLDLAYAARVQDGFDLPKNTFAEKMKMCAKIPLIHKSNNEDGYHDQNYYVTHIICALTHYGKHPVKKNKLTHRVFSYLDKNFDRIRYHENDLDLIGEVVYCYKAYKKNLDEKVKEAEKYLISQQRLDGYWGDVDSDDDPYDVFHPVWTSLTALHFDPF